MPLTPDKMALLEAAGQDMLKRPEYAFSIQHQIDNTVVASMPPKDDLGRTRAAKTPATGAIVHRLCSDAIATINEGDDLDVDTEQSAFANYQRLTTTFVTNAADKTIDTIRQPSDRFHRILTCYVLGTRALSASVDNNQESLRRAGRDLSNVEEITSEDTADTSPEDISAELEIIRGLLANNASTSSNLLFQGMARMAIQGKTLPPAKEIARRLRTDIPRMQLLSTSITPILLEQRMGQALTEKRAERIRQGLPGPVPDFGEIVRNFMDTGDVEPAAPELVRYFTQPQPDIPQRPNQPKGFCPAQFEYEPYEIPDSTTNHQHSDAWFLEHGVRLVNGAYSGAQFQIVRGIDAGERTIFADPDYRAACEELVWRFVK